MTMIATFSHTWRSVNLPSMFFLAPKGPSMDAIDRPLDALVSVVEDCCSAPIPKP